MISGFSFLGKDVNNSGTLPAHWYTDGAVFDAERRLIFLREWVAVARVDQLPNPGDFLNLNYFGIDLVLTRDRAGEIHALSNTCLHRAFPLTQGQGNCSALVCPYHKWSYGLDGQLRGAPNLEQAQGFDVTEKQLPSLAVELWQGWIFVNADKAAAPLAPRLAPVAELLSPWGLDDFRHVGSLPYPSAWNWKVMVDNFMESYHHMGAHPESLNGVYPAAGTYRLTGSDAFTVLENPSIDEALAAPFWVINIFPCTMFVLIRSSENPVLAWWQLKVRDHGNFDLEVHAMVPADHAADTDAVQQTLTALDAIHQEDIPMCEGVWKGLHDPLYQANGRLSHLEGCLWDFYRYLQKSLEG